MGDFISLILLSLHELINSAGLNVSEVQRREQV